MWEKVQSTAQESYALMINDKDSKEWENNNHHGHHLPLGGKQTSIAWLGEREQWIAIQR